MHSVAFFIAFLSPSSSPHISPPYLLPPPGIPALYYFFFSIYCWTCHQNQHQQHLSYVPCSSCPSFNRTPHTGQDSSAYAGATTQRNEQARRQSVNKLFASANRIHYLSKQQLRLRIQLPTLVRFCVDRLVHLTSGSITQSGYH